MRFSVLVPRIAPQQAFDAVADFGKLPDWDPAVKSVQLVEGEPMQVGAVYELIGSMLGGGLRLRYRIESIDAPAGVTYVGGTKNVTTTDVMRFETSPGGTRVSISSDMEFRGPTRRYGWAVRAGVYLGGRILSFPAMRRHLERLATTADS